MSLKSTAQRWGAIAQLAHWLVAVLIIAQGILGLVMVELPKRPSVFAIYNLHKSLGLTILALALLRLIWRAFDRRPLDPPGMPRWQRVISHGTHHLLYLLLFAVPLSGWLFDSASALRPLFWWNTIRMPSLTGGPSPALRHLAGETHETLFWILVAVAALHIGAALYHHVFQRDNVLRRMLPFTRLRPEPENLP
ncbi:cytochrome b [Oleiagrimonas sp. C23AA]|uniref:cytochrome b n=1 Tax=Oleiagrimonas sp. C23AA TaxID=2719047 RepID=UPI00141E639A|nr:cytochrome b [Oleiagrimonas sp. C23AA]NII12086.1 cytochrome b [Oleiagrimonas sp. C23AA]